MYKLSKYVHFIELVDKEYVAIHNSVLVSTIFVTRELSECLQNNLSTLSQDDIQELLSAGVLVDELNNENIDDIVNQKEFTPCLSVMYLILTDNCNLACKYCFIESSIPENYSRGVMTWDTLKKALDIFTKQRAKDRICQIWFYGGEPLLEKNLVFQALDYLIKNDSEVIPAIITNGTLLTEKTAEELSKYPNLQIAVSLDGNKAVNDRNRIYKNGAGSFEDVKAGISNLRKFNLKFGLSCTISEETADQIPETVSWLSSTMGTNDVGLNILLDTPGNFVSNEYIERVSDGIIESFQNERNGEIVEGRIVRKISSFVKQQPRFRDCAACGNQFVVSPDGKIGICHEGLGEKYSFVSSINESFDFYSNNEIKKWAARSPFKNATCLECEALGVCGGGCAYGAMLRHGDINEIDERFCEHSKRTLSWMVNDLFDKIKARLQNTQTAMGQ